MGEMMNAEFGMMNAVFFSSYIPHKTSHIYSIFSFNTSTISLKPSGSYSQHKEAMPKKAKL